MKLYQVFEASDGSIYRSQQACRQHEAALKGLKFECPKCKGLGFVRGDPMYEGRLNAEASALCGRLAQLQDVLVGYKMLDCDVCGGHGYTKTQVIV